MNEVTKNILENRVDDLESRLDRVRKDLEARLATEIARLDRWYGELAGRMNGLRGEHGCVDAGWRGCGAWCVHWLACLDHCAAEEASAGELPAA